MERKLTVEEKDGQIAVIDTTNVSIGILMNPIEARTVRNQLDSILKQMEQKDTTVKK